MKEISIKQAKYDEIVQHLRERIKGTNMFPDTQEVGSIWEIPHNTVEKQLNTAIDDGTPLVGIKLLQVVNENGWISTKRHVETFVISDMGERRTDLYIKRLDDEEYRNDKLDRLRMLLESEANSRDLYMRIMSAMKEFDGVAFAF